MTTRGKIAGVSRERPLIGLTVSPPEGGSPFYNLNPEYSDTVMKAGGDPLALPLIPDPAYADRMIRLVQGIVLIGSAYDMDPSRYGQEPHPNTKAPYPDRDALDMLLLERVFQRAIPVLGICHGCQAINVFAGGTILQDITGQVRGKIKHRTRSATGEYAHEITLIPKCILNPTAEERIVKVNSAHDQAIDRVGEGLRVIAYAGDGITEAIESDDMNTHFILGVQWHPERLAGEDTFSFLAFEKLVTAAAAWMASHHS